MFQVKFKNSTEPDLHDTRFRAILIYIIRQRQTGLVVNPFDQCVFMLENLDTFEDEAGKMIDRGMVI